MSEFLAVAVESVSVVAHQVRLGDAPALDHDVLVVATGAVLLPEVVSARSRTS